MSARRKRRGHFLCFSPVYLPEEEASVKTGESSAGYSGKTDVLAPEAHLPRRRRRRFLSKIFRSAVFVFSLNRSGRSVARMASDDKPAAELSGESSDGNKQTEGAILSSSSSTTSSSASSSCLSSASSSSFREPETKPKPELLRCDRASPRSESKNPQPPPPPARCHCSATGIFLLLLSLSVMVFCGRLYAILWTSSWLCLVPPRKSDAGSAVENATVVAPPELQRKGLEQDEKKRIVLEGLLERNRRV